MTDSSTCNSIELDVLLIYDEQAEAYTAIWMNKYLAGIGETPNDALDNLVYALCAELSYVLEHKVSPFSGVPDTPDEYRKMYFNATAQDIDVIPSVVDGQSVGLSSVRLAA